MSFNTPRVHLDKKIIAEALSRLIWAVQVELRDPAKRTSTLSNTLSRAEGVMEAYELEQAVNRGELTLEDASLLDSWKTIDLKNSNDRS